LVNQNGKTFGALIKTSEVLSVGRLDSRFTGVNEDLLSQTALTDSQSDAISGPYISVFKDYLYNDLKVRKNLTYTTSTGGRKDFKWDWSHKGNVILLIFFIRSSYFYPLHLSNESSKRIF